jgi:uncharacterized membrane protein YozB (DUF420 family)
MDSEFGEIIIRFGWQTAVIAFSALIIVGCIKPLIRKYVKSERQRHAIYQAIQFVLVFAITYAMHAIIAKAWVNPKDIIAGAVAGYTALNIIYPLYANLSVKDLVAKILCGVFGMLRKGTTGGTSNTGMVVDAKAESGAETQPKANDGEKEPVIVL